MCVRINNVCQSKDMLKYFYQKYNNFMHKQYNYVIKIKTNKKAASLNQNLKFEMYKTQILYKSLASKLEKIQNGLLKLLVFRVSNLLKIILKFFFNQFLFVKFNLFCKQAKTFLLSKDLNNLPMSIRLKPLIDFLTGNFEMLKYQLYPSLFSRFIKLLWESFYDVLLK